MSVTAVLPAVGQRLSGPLRLLIGPEHVDPVEGGVWTGDVARAHRFAARLRAGTVWVNQYGAVDAAAPFGGFKESGYGREHGNAALDLYLETKTIWVSTE